MQHRRSLRRSVLLAISLLSACAAADPSAPSAGAASLLLADNDAKSGRWEDAERRFAAIPRTGLMQILQPLAVAWSQAGEARFDEALATLRPYIDAPRMR